MFKEKLFDREPKDLFKDSIKFVENLFKEQRFLESLIIQFSIVEYLLEFLFLTRIDNLKIKNDFHTDKYIDYTSKLNFYQKIELSAALTFINKNTYDKLHTYRKKRNKIVHDSIFKKIDERYASELFKLGKILIKILMKKCDF